MPRYDYRCADCDHAFELRQSFSEAGKGVCPQCSGTGRRVFHAVPVIYKGSGFYTTDYKGTGYSPASKEVDEGDSAGKAQADAEKAKTDDKQKAEKLMETAEAAKKGTAI